MPALIQALQDPTEDAEVRVNVAVALGKISTPEALEAVVPALIQASQDKDTSVRASAAEALGSIGKDAVPTLIELLQDQDEKVRYYVALALKNIGTPEALKAVEEYQSRQ